MKADLDASRCFATLTCKQLVAAAAPLQALGVGSMAVIA